MAVDLSTLPDRVDLSNLPDKAVDLSNLPDRITPGEFTTLRVPEGAFGYEENLQQAYQQEHPQEFAPLSPATLIRQRLMQPTPETPFDITDMTGGLGTHAPYPIPEEPADALAQSLGFKQFGLTDEEAKSISGPLARFATSLSGHPEAAQDLTELGAKKLQDLTTPENVAIAAAMGVGGPFTAAAELAFAGQGGAGVLDAAQRLAQATTPQEKNDAIADMVLNASMVVPAIHPMFREGTRPIQPGRTMADLQDQALAQQPASWETPRPPGTTAADVSAGVSRSRQFTMVPEPRPQLQPAPTIDETLAATQPPPPPTQHEINTQILAKRQQVLSRIEEIRPQVMQARQLMPNGYGPLEAEWQQLNGWLNDPSQNPVVHAPPPEAATRVTDLRQEAPVLAPGVRPLAPEAPAGVRTAEVPTGAPEIPPQDRPYAGLPPEQPAAEPGAGTPPLAPAIDLPASTKNAIAEQERVSRGLDPVIKAAATDFPTAWDQSARELQTDPTKGQRLVDTLKLAPAAINDVDNAHLLRESIRRKLEYDAAVKAVNDSAPGSPENLGAQVRLAQTRQDYFDLHQAEMNAGTGTSRGLNARKMLANDDYSLAKIQARMQAANGGVPLNAKQLKVAQRLAAKAEQLRQQVDAMERAAMAGKTMKLADVSTSGAVGRTGVAGKIKERLSGRPVGPIGAVREAIKGKEMARVQSEDEFFGKIWPKLLRETGLTERSPLKAASRAVGDMDAWLKDNPQFKDYYEKDFKKTRQFIEKGFGRKLTEPEFRLFRLLNGIFSNQTPLKMNTRESINALKHYLTNGNFDAIRTYVSEKGGRKISPDNPFAITTASSPNKAFTVGHVINNLIKRFGGDTDKAINYLKEPVTMKELHAFNREVGFAGDAGDPGAIRHAVEFATGQSEKVPRMFIFGKKVGAYTLNNLGDARYNTVDVWESRFIKSYLKGMLEKNPGIAAGANEHEVFRTFVEEFNRIWRERVNPKENSSALQAGRWFYMIESAKKAGYTRGISNDVISQYAKEHFEEGQPLYTSGGKFDQAGGRSGDVSGTGETEGGIPSAAGSGGSAAESPRTLAERIKTLRPGAESGGASSGPTLDRYTRAYQTRLARQTAELKDKLARQDFTRTQRTQRVLDEKTFRMKAEYQQAKNDVEREIRKVEAQNAPRWERAMNTLVKGERALKLGGLTIYGKLGAAAATRLGERPLEQLVQSGLGQLPILSKVHQAATLSGFSPTAEMAALRGVVKGVKEAPGRIMGRHAPEEELYGKPNLEPRSWLDIPGQTHAAIKAPVQEAERARATTMLTEAARKQGLNLNDARVQADIGQAADQEAKRSIFMQDNIASVGWSNLMKYLETQKIAPTSGKITAAGMKILLPIVRVPTNIAIEAGVHTFGLGSGAIKLAQVMHRGLDTIRPEEANFIMRHYAKGAIGAGLFFTGYFMAANGQMSGFYQPGKRPAGVAPPMQIRIGGIDIPAWLLHAPAFLVMQAGATAYRASHHTDQYGQPDKSAVLQAAKGLAEQIPFVKETGVIDGILADEYQGRKVRGELLSGSLVPQAVKNIAQWTDPIKEPMYRSPRTAVDYLRASVPGWREQVRVKGGPSLVPQGLEQQNRQMMRELGIPVPPPQSKNLQQQIKRMQRQLEEGG